MRAPTTGGNVSKRICLLALLICLVFGAHASLARADGDPGSDVLVNQPLFFASDAGVGIAQENQLDGLLSRAHSAGFPVRVAIIAHADDLGAITPLWGKPQSYALYLDYELSGAFTGPLLVVMPGGFGFAWPGHAAAVAAAEHRLASVKVAAGGSGLVAATTTAVEQLASANGARLSGGSAPANTGAAKTGPAKTGAAKTGASSGAAGATTSAASSTAQSSAQAGPTILPSGRSGNSSLVIVAILAELLAILLTGWFGARRGIRFIAKRYSAEAGQGAPSAERRRARWAFPSLALVTAAGLVALLIVSPHGSSSQPVSDLATNPNLDPGTALTGIPAPDFALYDQFGRPVTLRQYRGKVVLLAFIDSECTTICPLTTTAMVDAKRLLGAAGNQVQLLGVDANPKDTQIEDVLSYSQLHGMTHAWRFATGTLGRLKAVWTDYHVAADIQAGLISHTAALFAIDPQGRERKVYTTVLSYTTVPQLGQLLAQEASRLLPKHPAVATHDSYGAVPSVSPAVKAELPRVGGGTVRIGSGTDRLYVFFDTWVQEVMPIGADLDALNSYAAAAAKDGLPPPVGVDEASVEPSASALPNFLHGLSSPLRYPVAVDSTGRVADGYEVQGEPWMVLTSSTGKILWYDEPDTSGWPTTTQLEADVRAALEHGPAAPASEAAAQRELEGSPAPLAALHEHASQLLGGESALAAEIRALRGYPIVINIWASWCIPCQAEFHLFADASAHYGRSVAFLGADYNDLSGDARTFLSEHPVSYPSYTLMPSQVGDLLPGGIPGTPTTVYVSPTGRLESIHSGQYETQGGLDGDIQTYALGG
jgi:cytochrome oxidase Cu insertion factor (SCO1/SenC/PrrC family)/thiol-disulfide isomerase/thioredoxin